MSDPKVLMKWINGLEEKIKRLTDELERQDKIIDRRDAHVMMLCEKLAEKDKRIEELMNHLKRAIAPVEAGGGTGGFHIVTTEQLASGEVVLLTQGQIDKAWEYVQNILFATKGNADFKRFAKEIFERIGIVACEECGGGVSKAWDNGCPSCHGHGWIITSVDVDKYGRIGTGEE